MDEQKKNMPQKSKLGLKAILLGLLILLPFVLYVNMQVNIPVLSYVFYGALLTVLAIIIAIN